MADGFFRVSHRPAATLTSTGPGSANLIMALAVAQTDSSELFSLTDNVPPFLFHRAPFSEMSLNQQAVFINVCKPVVKRRYQPTTVRMLSTLLVQDSPTKNIQQQTDR